jgi:hypothetical protein
VITLNPRARACLAAVLFYGLLSPAFGASAFVTSASAADDCAPRWVPKDHKYVYPCEVPGGSTGGGGAPASTGSGPRPKPSCGLSGRWTTCLGHRACLYSPWKPPAARPPGTRPPGATAWVRMCQDGLQSLGSTPRYLFTSLWRTTTTAEPPLIVQARQAIGSLRLPATRLVFSPPGRTYVGLDTWWWDTAPAPRTVRGSSAFGLRAVARPTALTIDPGDGTEPTDCPPVTTRDQAEQDCYTTYTRSSVAGTATYHGQPAYTATATTRWQVEFTNDGTPVTFPDLDTTVPGPPTHTTVPVYEIQTIVTNP